MNEINVTLNSNNIGVVVTPANIEVANDVYVSVASGNAISVTPGTSQAINVSAVRTGPPGTGFGTLLQDYGVVGQLPNWSGPVTANLDNGNVVQPTLIGNVTQVTITGWPPAGVEGKLVLYIPQGSQNYVIEGWPESIKWLGGVPPVLTTQNGQVDVVVLTSIDGGTNIFGFHIGVAA